MLKYFEMCVVMKRSELMVMIQLMINLILLMAGLCGPQGRKVEIIPFTSKLYMKNDIILVIQMD